MATAPPNQRPGKPFTPGPAAQAVISLSQAILAPLDALAKAQVHAARSFLNLVLQIGYPHRPLDENNRQVDTANDSLYCETFQIEQNVLDEKGNPVRRHVGMRMPTLALVPLQPLNIESANFSLELAISEIEHHQQMQSGKVDEPARPWYLVNDPVSVRGTLTPPGNDNQQQRQASIKIDVHLTRGPTPAGLAKLLTTLTQASALTPPPDPEPGDANKPPV